MWALWLLEMPSNATTSVWCWDYSSPFTIHTQNSTQLKKMQKDAFILEVRVQSAVQKLRPMATTQCMP